MAQAALPESLRQQWLWFAPPAPSASNIRLIDLIEDAPSDVSWHRPDETRALLAMMSPVNRAKLDLVAANDGRAVGAIYKRTRIEAGRKVQRAEVRFDLAGCLRTPAGGSSRQSLIFVDAGRIRSRLVSARETARLMGLPDDYKLPPRYTEAYHLTGDGVAAPVVRFIAQTILEPVLGMGSAAGRAVG